MTNISLGQTIDESLSSTDLENPKKLGSFSDDYTLSGFSNWQQVQVNMDSTAIDSYLQLVNASTGEVIAFNDDLGSSLNSQLSFTKYPGIDYTIRATSSNSGVTGNYTLKTTSLGVASSIIATRDGKVGTVDATSGNFAQIATSNLDFSDIALSNSGQLFGITFGNLYKIEPNLGSASLIGNFGLDSSVNLNALEFANNTLYAADFSNLYTINSSTGAATLVANLGSGFISSGDLVFDAANNLLLATSLGTTSDSLFSISLTGQATKIGNLGFTGVFGLSLENGNLIGFTQDRERITINSTTGTGTLDKNLTGVSGSIGGASSILSATPTPTPPTPTPPTPTPPTPTPPTPTPPTPTPPTPTPPTPTPPTPTPPTPTPPTPTPPTPTPPTPTPPTPTPPTPTPTPPSISEVDLDPLRLKVVGGQFVFNNTTKRYESSGTVQIGLKNGSFPLLSVNGSVSYDNQTIKANGIFSPTIGGLTVPLYEGDLEFDVGKAVAKSVRETTQAVANQFKLAGTEVEFTNLAFTQKGIELEGTLQFPPELFGGTKLDITGNNKILISNDGVSLTGGKIDFPDVNFNIEDLLEVKGTGLALGYTTDQRAGITLQGKAELVVFDPSPTPTPTPPFTVTADFADPNYIKINRDFSPIVDVNGSFSLDNIKLVPKVWEIKNAKLSLDTQAKEVKGEGTILIPSGIEISGGLGFVDKKLNFIKIGGSNLNKPIGATGAFLQSISGQVNNLTKPDLIESSLTNVGVTAGSKLTISLPSWAGGDVSGTAVELNASGSITRDRLKTNGTIKIAGGLVEGKGEAELNWNKKFFNAEADFSMLGGLINTKSKFTADKDFNIIMGGAASVKVPDISIEIPKVKILDNFEVGGGKIKFKGQPLAQAEFAFNYSNDNNLSNDFVQAYGKLPPMEFFNPLNFNEPIKIEYEATIKVSFDGKAEASVGKPVPRTNSSIITSSQIERVASGNQLEASADKTASAIQGFTVAPGTPWIILNANWDNATANTPVEIKAPTGAIFKESDFAANNIAIVDALTSATTKAVMIANPQPGTWDINLTNPTGLGTVEYSAFQDSQAPTVQVTAPSKDVSGQNVTINYNAFDSDSTAKVSLFYDNDNQGFDGILIKDGLEEKDGAGNFVWNTQGLPTGDYYVYAMAMDENNAPVFSYAPLPIKVTESADLSVTKTADRDTAIPGTNLTYTVAVTNNGTDNAKGAILTETLPEGAKFVSANIAPTKQSGNELTFDLGDVPKGQISTVSITVTAPTTGNIIGTSSITSKTFDPDISNDVDFASTTVTNDGTESATDNVVQTPTPTPPRPPLRQVLGTPENDNLVGIDAADSMAGFAGDDTLAGLGGDDIIYGNKGNDILTGDSGNDNIFGGQGNDIILGGTDNDRLKGNEGDDTLSGDLGRDILIGGPGSDTFVLPTNAAVTGDFLPDAILDFQLGADKIGLTEGLTEANLLLNFEEGNTIIKIASSNQILGLVVGVSPSQLSGSFVSINLPVI
ncbi:hypothetical protein QUB53_03565 [Microcoleus sp. AT8-B4]|uniref:hypothetical protein n=1 Tax=Microcoleus sp. AT8-B4 TaxID=2818620 RepID=UPI002FD0EF29